MSPIIQKVTEIVGKNALTLEDGQKLYSIIYRASPLRADGRRQKAEGLNLLLPSRLGLRPLLLRRYGVRWGLKPLPNKRTSALCLHSSAFVYPILKAGCLVELDFAGVEMIASCFVNNAVAQLLRDIDSEDLRKLLQVKNLGSAHKALLKQSINATKKKLLLRKAIEIATKAHLGQVDKGGYPYIGHPLRVMNAVEATEEKIVAVLHDVIEDTSVSYDDLHEEGFSHTVVFAHREADLFEIAALTKIDGEPRKTYLKRIIDNPLALKVKIADLEDNCNLERTQNPSERDFARTKRYNQELQKLKKVQLGQESFYGK